MSAYARFTHLITSNPSQHLIDFKVLAEIQGFRGIRLEKVHPVRSSMDILTAYAVRFVFEPMLSIMENRGLKATIPTVSNPHCDSNQTEGVCSIRNA